MLTPREAISRNQVFLRPFAYFCPADQAFMGFSSEQIRDQFYEQIEHGALVLIWTRSQDSEAGWQGFFRGMLQLGKAKVDPRKFSTPAGEKLRAESDADYASGVEVLRAWEARPDPKTIMRNIIPSDWPRARSIGVRSSKMNPNDLPNIEGRFVREISVFGHPPISPAAFSKIKDLFK